MTGSIVLEYKLHVQISTFGALWAKLPYQFPRNTLADGFFQKWKSLYYGGIPGVLQKVVKMSTAGKAYTTVRSWWRKTDYGLEFRDERGGGDNTNKM